jgi:isopropylmalate/homocitrate/citramalate synthase
VRVCVDIDPPAPQGDDPIRLVRHETGGAAPIFPRLACVSFAAVRVTVCDVGPRDGLQNEPAVLAPAVRAELVNRLAAAGLPAVEAVSFVHPGRVPQMAGAEEVVAGIERREGVAYSGLVLNARGFGRFAASGLDELHFNLSATDSFGRRNQNATPEEALAVLEAIETEAPVSVSISVAFGCPFEGAVDPGRVLDLAERSVAAGAREVVFADTIGVAVPRQVRHLVAEGAARLPRVGVHLHNTRNTGFAAAYAALEAGAEAFESSVGGLGGCPFAPRATGNVATEDLVYLLHGEGVETGVDLDGLIEVSLWLEGVLGRELPGQVYRAGTFAPVAG